METKISGLAYNMYNFSYLNLILRSYSYSFRSFNINCITAWNIYINLWVHKKLDPKMCSSMNFFKVNMLVYPIHPMHNLIPHKKIMRSAWFHVVKVEWEILIFRLKIDYVKLYFLWKNEGNCKIYQWKTTKFSS